MSNLIVALTKQDLGEIEENLHTVFSNVGFIKSKLDNGEDITEELDKISNASSNLWRVLHP